MIQQLMFLLDVFFKQVLLQKGFLIIQLLDSKECGVKDG